MARARQPQTLAHQRLAPGVQPVDSSGRLQCRYCGRWFRGLGHHVFPAHGVTPDGYRREFELASTRPLVASDLSAALAARSRSRFRSDAAFRQVFAISAEERAARNQQGRRAKQRTEHRAGVQRSKRAVGEMLAQHSRQRAADVRADLDAKARDLGYRDLHNLLVETVHLTHVAVGDLLNCSAAKARAWRRIHEVRSTARSTTAQATLAHRRGLIAASPVGVQPVDGDGRLLCRECGRWWRDLGQHVLRTHHQRFDDYQRRHSLGVGNPTASESLTARRATFGRAVGAANLRAAAQAKSIRVKAAYDQRARQRGYSDIAELLVATPDRHSVAAVIGCAPTSVSRIRRRYLHI